jgi:elongation factor P
MVRPDIWGGPTLATPSDNRGRSTVKVIASSLRKGNIVDLDGKLYVVLNAESFHPARAPRPAGRHAPDQRWGKDRAAYKTTEQVDAPMWRIAITSSCIRTARLPIS